MPRASIRRVKATGTFSVSSFVPTEVVPDPTITTALPVGVALIAKQFSGAIEGRSSTVFTAAFDQATGVGSYTAMESFEGTLDAAAGAFNFLHVASTSGADRTNEFCVIVPGSGTGDLAGITGTGGLHVDADGTHHIWFDYEL
ncbi:DUF3224 domain-containing protein [Nocardia sputorum]|uniref:DUF3224 domain-containing protein n=1 Tax=Nocardia sputorum TaxID=2984338 RepID=UPI0024916D15|nr:DUF3224 domain-containing protein [Nocardia sputorum]